MPEAIAVAGVMGDELGKAAARALADADLVVGGSRLLDEHAPAHRRQVPIGADVDAVLDAIEGEPGRVCVLASGDPGFFGIVRALAARFGREALDVHPAPSSVSVAFARVGLPWDDAVVVSAHGRPLGDAVDAVLAARGAVAVLTSPTNPPHALGEALRQAGACERQVVVCSALGAPDEEITATDLAGLASGDWAPHSVVLLLSDHQRAPRADKTLAWGLPDGAYDHRAGMITKAEVRAVALGKLGLPGRGVMWDVGAGSGSVAVECARLAPGVRVFAVERDADAAKLVARNADTHGVAVNVVHGAAPGALAGLPDPDCAFVGGGGIDVLEAVQARLRPGGRVVATFAALDRAVAAASRLGELVQISVSRGSRLPDGAVRLEAENPVFVCWGSR